MKLEGVKTFCYLRDIVNGEGRSDSAMVAGVRCAWKKFWELSGMLTKRGVSLKLKGKVYATCVRSTMIYGSETWVLNKEQQQRLSQTRKVLIYQKNRELNDDILKQEQRWAL